MSGAEWGLFAATFAACFVESVEAATIVLAIGLTRGWRSAAYGIVAALVALGAVTAALRAALLDVVSESALQLVVGALLLLFGMQWMRKAVLRSAGVKDLHDEDAIYAREVATARAADTAASPFDAFAFVVVFKGVFLEGMEVVFIVLTFGLSAGDVPLASAAAAAAALCVCGLVVALRMPLSMVDENLLKYGVALMLTSFGTFWSVEGMGVFRSGHASVAWPGGDWAIPALIACWLLASRLLIAVVRPGRPGGPAATARSAVEGAR